ncbi:hypothetical protein IFR05_007459 [Cadophora sp. M221]|nr:hypothetical protein IFR05_007459 [Cadophora sp. M221]
MQLTNLLTVALLALGATAIPAPEPAPVEGRTLGLILCIKSGGKYNLWTHKCEYPSYPPPSCYQPEHGWCSKSKYEYTSYNKAHDWCKKDGYNKVWCSDDGHAAENCKKQYY